MDAPNPSALPTFASRTPLHIGAVGLIVRDLDNVAAFYRDVVGLAEIERGNGVARLGAGGTTLLELAHRPDAPPDDPRHAGLYHTAFLMPTRADLARWVVHVARNRVPISGASDHSVSEAFYLDDPEGNGIEVYSDRPAETWHWADGGVEMLTEPLDVEAIVDEIDPQTASYDGAPTGLRVGHVHLRVGDLDQAEKFYRDIVGLDVTRRRHGASFMSSGRYHHHIGANVWHSAGAGQRDPERAGLSWFTIAANDGATRDALTARLRKADIPVSTETGGLETRDPWGTRLRLALA